jgi:hypothetical protein
LQYVAVSVLLPPEVLGAAIADANGAQPMPGWLRLIIGHLPLVMIAFVVLSLVTLVAAIGLLARRNWARLVFIGLMILAAVSNLVGAAIPFVVSDVMPAMSELPADLRDQIALLSNVVTVASVAIGVVFAGLFAWLVKRLMSPEVKAEFGVA